MAPIPKLFFPLSYIPTHPKSYLVSLHFQFILSFSLIRPTSPFKSSSFYVVFYILSYKSMYNTHHKKEHGQRRAKECVKINVHIIFPPWRKQRCSRTAEFPTVPFLHLCYTDGMFIAWFRLLLLSIYSRTSSLLLHVLCNGTYSAYLFFLKSLLLTCVACVSDICVASLLSCICFLRHTWALCIYMHLYMYICNMGMDMHMIQIHDKNTYLLQH